MIKGNPAQTSQFVSLPCGPETVYPALVSDCEQELLARVGWGGTGPGPGLD